MSPNSTSNLRAYLYYHTPFRLEYPHPRNPQMQHIPNSFPILDAELIDELVDFVSSTLLISVLTGINFLRVCCDCLISQQII